MKEYVWKYWFAGMKRPSKMPKCCEWLGSLKWIKCRGQNPKDWSEHPRRWKVALKTCKWGHHDNCQSMIENPHNESLHSKWQIKYCPTCGKPVEIVKGETK